MRFEDKLNIYEARNIKEEEREYLMFNSLRLGCIYAHLQLRIYRDVCIEYHRVVDIFEFYTPRIRNDEIRIMKYLYVEITIVNNDVLVLWRGREGFFPSVGC